VRDEDRVEREPEPAYVAPARVWSSTEVLGDAPERPSRAPRLPRAERVRVPSRGVAVPLLALAVGLGLPVAPYGAVNGLIGVGHVRVAHVASHVLAGLIAGGALAAAALWLDVWERALVLGAFALLAVGVAVGAAFPRTVANGYWTFGAAGVAAGLVAPGVVRALRRIDPPGRLAILAGTGVAIALLAGVAFAQARAIFPGWTSY
jgi:hypothetical protein